VRTGDINPLNKNVFNERISEKNSKKSLGRLSMASNTPVAGQGEMKQAKESKTEHDSHRRRSWSILGMEEQWIKLLVEDNPKPKVLRKKNMN